MTTTSRGYGHTHQQLRALLLPLAIGKPCPICGIQMLPTDTLDLDHSITPRQLTGDRIVHATCNRRAGANTKNELHGDSWRRR